MYFSAMLVLGSKLQEENHDNFIRIPGSGFNGYLSHIYMWKTALNFLTEIPSLAASRNNKVRVPNCYKCICSPCILSVTCTFKNLFK